MSDIADELRTFEGSEALGNGDFSACYRGAAEITRLRAACDAYFKTISLSQIRHGRILVGLERRNARQRRVLAKLYQRRHDKNVALATARLEGIGEAVSQARARADFWGSGNNKEAKIRHDEARKIAAAISAAAKEVK